MFAFRQRGGAIVNAEDIERYLWLVGEELKGMNVQEPVELLLVGGGYMVTQIGNRPATGDVDVAWLRPEIYSASELYRLFRSAVRFVANDEGLELSWLSVDVGDFIRAAGPLPKVKLWKKF